MKNATFVSVLMTFLMSPLAFANSYLCFNQSARSQDQASVVAEVNLSKSGISLNTLKNTQNGPANWQLNPGETLNLQPLRQGQVPNLTLNPDYIYFFTKNQAGALVDVRLKKDEFQDQGFRLIWDIEAIPATRDEAARGTNGVLLCTEK